MSSPLRELSRGPPALAPRVPRRCVTRASEGWWSQAGSNRRPLACHASALPAELWPRNRPRDSNDARGKNPEHSSGLISSLLVASDVADDVGDVLVAFFLVGNKGRIVLVDDF